MASAAPLYVVSSETHFDDYKRAKTTHSVVGVFSSCESAQKVAILGLIKAMQAHIAIKSVETEPIAEVVRDFCEECKGDEFDVSEGWDEAQELAETLYGEPEYSTVKSSGVRFFVQELPAIDQTIDGDIRAEDLKRSWADEVSGLEAYTPGTSSEESQESEDESEAEDTDAEDVDSGLEEMEQDELTSLLQEAAEGTEEGTSAEMAEDLKT